MGRDRDCHATLVAMTGCGGFHPHPNPLPSKERESRIRPVHQCKTAVPLSLDGMTRVRMDVLQEVFTLTLALSHQGRGDIAEVAYPCQPWARGLGEGHKAHAYPLQSVIATPYLIRGWQSRRRSNGGLPACVQPQRDCHVVRQAHHERLHSSQ